MIETNRMIQWEYRVSTFNGCESSNKTHIYQITKSSILRSNKITKCIADIDVIILGTLTLRTQWITNILKMNEST